ncbi:MAG: zinc-ribbon domain-containing protein [Candidatus Lokiarchaeota archaeon]|nr:zinc-ribbon domain-containing protein [Candidatus Lokiarchaeota archaeon]
MGELNCYFHKDRTAVSKCDTCGKCICLECRYERESGSHSHSTEYVMCPLCYADVLENNENYDGIIGAIFGCFVFVIFFAITISAIDSVSSFGSSIHESPTWEKGPLIAFVVIFVIAVSAIVVYQVVKKDTEPNKQAEAIRAKAKKALEESKNIQGGIKSEKSHSPVYCSFCGAPIQPYATTCEYCGMKWVWK